MKISLTKFFWFFWKVNFNFAKKLRFGSTLEELTIISVFGLSVFFSIFFASILLFLEIEKKFAIDTKIVSLIFFIIVSAIQLKFFFGKGKNFIKFQNCLMHFKEVVFFCLLWLIALIVLASAMIYDYFNGNWFLFLNYLKNMNTQ